MTVVPINITQLVLRNVTEEDPNDCKLYKALSVNLTGGQDNAPSRHRVRIHPSGYLSRV